VLGEAFIRTTGIVKGVMTAIALMRSAWSLCEISISWSALCSTGIASCNPRVPVYLKWGPAVSSGALRIVSVGIDCAGIVSGVGPRDCNGGVASTGVVALDCNGTVAVAVDKAKFVGVAAVFVIAQHCTSLAAPSV
jgi:hypothetical protein